MIWLLPLPQQLKFFVTIEAWKPCELLEGSREASQVIKFINPNCVHQCRLSIFLFSFQNFVCKRDRSYLYLIKSLVCYKIPEDDLASSVHNLFDREFFASESKPIAVFIIVLWLLLYFKLFAGLHREKRDGHWAIGIIYIFFLSLNWFLTNETKCFLWHQLISLLETEICREVAAPLIVHL